MSERIFRQGDMLLRTGVSLPHLGVYSGQVYEVEDYHHHAEGLYVKGVDEGLDPASFQPISEPI
ncbi:hypothetical protein [Caulobacter sp. 602-1]|jgi:hypothetical protein|uniref:hypothetical protein n=1 Tax=unclassified Caulobacter TaxID=2648921 RepID=UPI000F62F2F2|nr:hypothetical protein [Caulobacter sp. 602-1]RRN66238.1 hypothetical protein EIK80_02870 [Caulobacter sp. 602-1]